MANLFNCQCFRGHVILVNSNVTLKFNATLSFAAISFAQFLPTMILVGLYNSFLQNCSEWPGSLAIFHPLHVLQCRTELGFSPLPVFSFRIGQFPTEKASVMLITSIELFGFGLSISIHGTSIINKWMFYGCLLVEKQLLSQID